MILVIEAGYHGMVAFSACRHLTGLNVDQDLRFCPLRARPRGLTSRRGRAHKSGSGNGLVTRSITSAIRFLRASGNHASPQANQGGYVNRSGGESKMELIGVIDERAF